MTANRHNTASGGLDWWAVMIWAALVLIGWISIFAAGYDGQGFHLAMNQRHTMQLIWIGVSVFLAAAILLIDDRYYHQLSYPLYILSLLMLVAVYLFGKEVNGAKSWINIGPIALQPTEFVKFTTSLAVARIMSDYGFTVRRLGNLLSVVVLIALPVGIIVLQNDTGSALVYASFAMMLYLEGVPGWLYLVGGLILLLFVASFLVTPVALLIILILLCLIGEGIANGKWKSKIVYAAGLALSTVALYFLLNLIPGRDFSAYACLLFCSIFSLPFVAIYSYRHRLGNIYIFVAVFLGSLLFSLAIDYVFENVMQIHQQKRILDLLGLEQDLKGWGYNVNQSKIAIGSGGLLGKGFLNGTQTKFNFVPEQTTDFIFCTVGEEWGFLGSALVVGLFAWMILKLIAMGKRQGEPFGRVYCYSAAGIFFFHVAVNIGMTIGLVPVIGIPLPFISYGGSSLLAFTVLYFVAIKLDARKHLGYGV